MTWLAGSLPWVAHPLADAGCDLGWRHLHMWAGSISSAFSRLAGFPALTCSPSPSALAGSVWNAASFYQEASYLYFPTLQAELASDISFYFKSSAPSGVFLENLGLKDFIRLELTCESTLGLRRPACARGLGERGCVATQERAGGGWGGSCQRWFYYFPSSQETRAGVSLTVSFPREARAPSGPRSVM